MTRVGYVPGAYDMFHVGHLNIIRNSANECDRLIAGVVSEVLSSSACAPEPASARRRTEMSA